MNTARRPDNRSWIFCILILLAAGRGLAQIDPEHRELLEAGYDQPLEGQGPQGGYVFAYYNDPNLFNTNTALRLVVAPTYLNSELGLRQLISPTTDVGLGLEGGGYADNYYEIRQGKFIKGESFNGYGGGIFDSIYQQLNPGMEIPLALIVRGGFHYATFHNANQTSDHFLLPSDQYDPFARVGLRLAGNQPVLTPPLGMEVSAWYEHQWRLENGAYGFDDDRQVNPGLNLYWVYAGMDYSFTNSGQRVAFAMTVGGSSDADRLGAWRLGGVLPFASEYPLAIPGYNYDELTAERFVHFYAAYDFPLVPSQCLKLRIEGASANVSYLPGLEQRGPWQSGVGCDLIIAPRNRNFQVILRYGYGFNAIRDGSLGAQSVGVLFQYNFGGHKKSDN
jgi:hypothetical protein